MPDRGRRPHGCSFIDSLPLSELLCHRRVTLGGVSHWAGGAGSRRARTPRPRKHRRFWQTGHVTHISKRQSVCSVAGGCQSGYITGPNHGTHNSHPPPSVATVLETTVCCLWTWGSLHPLPPAKSPQPLPLG